ncbi:MAG: hypothetical protein WAU07_01660, partial [Microgenomates group bacterium]
MVNLVTRIGWRRVALVFVAGLIFAISLYLLYTFLKPSNGDSSLKSNISTDQLSESGDKTREQLGTINGASSPGQVQGVQDGEENSLVIRIRTIFRNTVEGLSLVLSEGLEVNGPVVFTDTLQVSGPATLTSTLNVSESATLGDTLDVVGIVTLNDILNVAGDVDLESALAVTGPVTFSDALSVAGTANFLADALITGGLTT